MQVSDVCSLLTYDVYLRYGWEQCCLKERNQPSIMWLGNWPTWFSSASCSPMNKHWLSPWFRCVGYGMKTMSTICFMPCIMLYFLFLDYYIIHILSWWSGSSWTHLKFIYSEKARKFEKMSQFYLNFLVTSKKDGRFFQIFVDFSEYMHFRYSCSRT